MEETVETNQAPINHEAVIYDYNVFPQTRFQGSKYRLIDWLHVYLSELEFNTVLDAFSGSGIVSYYFKSQNKEVTANDVLKSSFLTAKAFIENSEEKISDDLLKCILKLPKYDYHAHIIEENYEGFYYTNEENIWLDGIISNIRSIDNDYHQSLLYWALFQACIIKRPYNLFHRKNLYMRLDDVERSFGNKTTWDRSFPKYMKKFTKEANNAVFSNKKDNRALNLDITSIENEDFDLVYLDPPYMKQNKNMSGNDYQDYYHFLEGILDYDNWMSKINYKLKHNPYTMDKSNWIEPNMIKEEFESVFDKFQESIIVISYNTEGYPSPSCLKEMLESYKDNVDIYYKNIKYALKKKNRRNTEVLLVAKS